jgi:hypothetical protein
MIAKLLGLILPLILLFTFLVKADVPPENGYVRVSIDLVTETEEDLSDYRFFLDFYGDLREVAVKSKGRAVIPSMGGGARYSSGTFLAIPKKNLKGYGGELSTDQLHELSQLIKAKKIEGVVELARHRFSADIPKDEKPAEVYYILKRDGETLKAEKISKEQPKTSSNLQTVSASSRIGLIAGGILITLAVVFAGVFAFRKVSKKV